MSSARHSAIWELRLRQFVLPKSGHALSECEDAIGVDEDNCRFAVADGATEAFDARNWAQRLAHNWVRSDSALVPDAFNEWVTAEGLALHSSWNQLNFPWYAEEKARNGSFAAFIGVQLDLKAKTPSWKAVALGDACLLHCRNGKLLKSLPMANSEDFNNGPMLVASDPANYKSSAETLVIDSGFCESHDVLFLLSDAVAAWSLRRFEQNEFVDVFENNDDASLAGLFESERAAGRIRNDDIAIMRLEIQERSTS
jgi:hypothetical protein